MSDRQVAALAVLVWVAALVPVGSSLHPVVLAGAVGVVALRRRLPYLLLAAAVVMASCGAGAAWARVDSSEHEVFIEEVVLLSDPEPVTGGVRFTGLVDGRRFDLRAWGSPAGHLRSRLMGERVAAEVKVRPLDDAPEWLLAQGLAGRGTVLAVDGFDVGSPHTRLANSIRRTIESGASSLDRDERSLFAGLVYGDDRLQSPLTADNFEAAGLTHLLAVSGQNVAFVLAIVGPVLRRLSFRPRFGFVVGVLLLFATVTRFEASVVRASVMTAVAAVGALVGTELSSRRVLALAVAGLVLVDPLMVHSVAFQLSVAASAGILLWSGRVARAVPGPRVFVESLAVTATAQLAVAPLLVWHFDGLPVASLPANVLAGPAAGPVMMWGLTAGLVAGLVPGWLAVVLHWPTRVMLWWIDSVAAWVPQLPLGRLGAVHIGLLFVAGSWGLRQTVRGRRVVAAAVVLVVLLAPAVVLAASPASSAVLGDGVVVWRDESVTVVELGAASRPPEVLAGLRGANVGRIDVLVVPRSSFANASLVGWIRSQRDVTAVWAPEPTMGVGELTPADGSRIVVDGITLTITYDDNHLILTPTR